MCNADSAAEQDRRTEYLLEWRNGLWTQIRHKENAIWRFMSFYAGALVVSAGLVKGLGADRLGIAGWLSLVLVATIVSVWGIVIVLDANFWMMRNLIFIGNIEREFLMKPDLGTLLPDYYADPPSFTYVRGYKPHLAILFFSLILVLLGCVGLGLANPGSFTLGELALLGLVACTFSGGLLYVLWRDRDWWNDWKRVKADAPGRNPCSQDRSSPYARLAFRLRSLITGWIWLAALLGLGIFSALASLYTPWSGVLQPMIFPFCVGLFVLCALGFSFRMLTSWIVLPVYRDKLDELSTTWRGLLSAYLHLMQFFSDLAKLIREAALLTVLVAWFLVFIVISAGMLRGI